MLKKSIVTLLLFGLSCTSAWAERTIVCATEAQWPPMEFMNDDGKVAGFTIDLMEEVGRAAGFKVVFETVDWQGMQAGLNEGKYDAICSSASITEERSKEVDFSLPYYVTRQVLVLQSDKRIGGTTDFTGWRVGVQKDTTGYDFAQTLDQLP